VKWLLIGFVKAWRALLSPMYGQVCKYYPSCSEYGLEALQTHGAIKGTRLAIWRILRCNPWSHGGVDPVPGSQLEAKIDQWWGPSWRIDRAHHGADLTEMMTSRADTLEPNAAPARDGKTQ